MMVEDSSVIDLITRNGAEDTAVTLAHDLQTIKAHLAAQPMMIARTGISESEDPQFQVFPQTVRGG